MAAAEQDSEELVNSVQNAAKHHRQTKLQTETMWINCYNMLKYMLENTKLAIVDDNSKKALPLQLVTCAVADAAQLRSLNGIQPSSRPDHYFQLPNIMEVAHWQLFIPIEEWPQIGFPFKPVDARKVLNLFQLGRIQTWQELQESIQNHQLNSKFIVDNVGLETLADWIHHPPLETNFFILLDFWSYNHIRKLLIELYLPIKYGADYLEKKPIQEWMQGTIYLLFSLLKMKIFKLLLLFVFVAIRQKLAFHGICTILPISRYLFFGWIAFTVSNRNVV